MGMLAPATTRMRFILAGLLIAGCGASGYWLASSLRKTAPASTALRLSKSSSSLGELREAEITRRKLVVENTTDKEIRITHFHGDCRCASFVPRSMKVPPHGSGEVEVTIDLDQSRANRTRVNLLVIADAIDAEGHNTTTKWRLEGRVIHDVSLSADHIDFSELTKMKALSARRKVEVRGRRGLWSVKATIVEGGFLAEPKRVSATRYEILVRPKPPLLARSVDGRVKVEVWVKGASKPLRFVVPVTLRVLPEIEAIPDRILLGRQNLGTTVHEEVLVVSRSGKPLTLVAMGGSKGVAIEQIGGNLKQELRFEIRYEFLREGVQGSQAWIDVRQKGVAETERVAVPLEALGARQGPGNGENGHDDRHE